VKKKRGSLTAQTHEAMTNSLHRSGCGDPYDVVHIYRKYKQKMATKASY